MFQKRPVLLHKVRGSTYQLLKQKPPLELPILQKSEQLHFRVWHPAYRTG